MRTQEEIIPNEGARAVGNRRMKLPAATANGGRSHRADSKSKTKEIADLQRALAEVKAERDGALHRLAEIAADTDESTVDELQQRLAGLARKVESLTQDRDDLIA